MRLVQRHKSNVGDVCPDASAGERSVSFRRRSMRVGIATDYGGYGLKQEAFGAELRND